MLAANNTDNIFALISMIISIISLLISSIAITIEISRHSYEKVNLKVHVEPYRSFDYQGWYVSDLYNDDGNMYSLIFNVTLINKSSFPLHILKVQLLDDCREFNAPYGYYDNIEIKYFDGYYNTHFSLNTQLEIPKYMEPYSSIYGCLIFPIASRPKMLPECKYEVIKVKIFKSRGNKKFTLRIPALFYDAYEPNTNPENRIEILRIDIDDNK